MLSENVDFVKKLKINQLFLTVLSKSSSLAPKVFPVIHFLKENPRNGIQQNVTCKYFRLCVSHNVTVKNVFSRNSSTVSRVYFLALTILCPWRVVSNEPKGKFPLQQTVITSSILYFYFTESNHSRRTKTSRTYGRHWNPIFDFLRFCLDS